MYCGCNCNCNCNAGCLHPTSCRRALLPCVKQACWCMQHSKKSQSVKHHGALMEPTLRPRLSSSLWMARPDTHLDSPPDLAVVRLSRAMRSVAPWSLWKARRVVSLWQPTFSPCLGAGRLGLLLTAAPGVSQQGKVWVTAGSRGNVSCRQSV